MINTWTIYIQLFRYCTLFGLQGSSIDSLLGATLQFSGYDRELNLISSFLTSIIAIWILPTSEFGSVQAQNNPRLLTNPFRIVPVGTNDAISLVGCSSIDSLLGATLQFSGYDRERNVTVQIPGPSIE
ncbi:unnamed protein product [Rotaria sordida]|uniref:Transmembrane protein 19 n=1 Tax=Rotaria sordida TaxID=392033 RepID=A0A815I352_9BILA|nr:unnamed protein product [Rotaria sordida]